MSMGNIEHWAHVVIDMETQEPTSLNDDEIEAVDDALGTGKGLELLSVVPTTDYRGSVSDAEQAIMDALSWMDPETAKRFMAEASYKRLAARIAAAGGAVDRMGNIERKTKPDVAPKPWDYLGWQGEQPTIDDLPHSRAPELAAEVERLEAQLQGSVDALELLCTPVAGRSEDEVIAETERRWKIARDTLAHLRGR